MQLNQWLKKQWPIVGLLIFSLIIRVFFIKDGVIPFQFDHGKDSLAILDMVVNFSPKFVGPWTSIPGLRFGPGWYYLLAPAYLLGQGNPLSPVFLMILLLLIQTYLFYRFFGWEATVISACAISWITIARSAWNPFPITLVSLLILIVLKQVKQQQKLTITSAIELGFISSLGFHFSTAFAIFYLPIIGLSLLIRKIKWQWQALVTGAIAFLIPFLPQIAFELKHGFPEVKGVIAYIKNPDSIATEVTAAESFWQKTISISQQYLGELRLGLIPQFSFKTEWLNQLLGLVVLAMIAYGIGRAIKRKSVNLSWETMLFLLIPLLGFWFLHFNVWYVLGAIPALVVLAQDGLKQINKSGRVIFSGLLLLGVLLHLHFFLTIDKPVLAANPTFLPTKLSVMSAVRNYAAGRPFAVYHYQPPIYDYGYQYLYFWQAWQGLALPTEFSYKPGEVSYMPEKEALVTRFKDQQTSVAPQLVFFVIENPENPLLLQEWWGQQIPHQVLDTKVITSKVSLVIARPLSSP